LLDSLGMEYIIGVKQDDHAYLFEWSKDLKPIVHQQTDEKGTQHQFHVYTCIGDPTSKPPPVGSGWLIA
jgi:hypothetical protein